MALADSVPGVSGGTIAFLLGFYDKFIDSLEQIMGKDKEKRKEAILFLLKIAGGWIIGMGGSVLVLASLFERNIYQISSLFLGLILFSIPLIIVEEKKVLKGHYQNLVFLVIGVALVVILSCINPVSGQGISVDVGSLNPGLCLYVFVAGAVAICAMVLPGISGSTLLLIFGLYISAGFGDLWAGSPYGNRSGDQGNQGQPEEIPVPDDLFDHRYDDRISVRHCRGTNDAVRTAGAAHSVHVPYHFLPHRSGSGSWAPEAEDGRGEGIKHCSKRLFHGNYERNGKAFF